MESVEAPIRYIVYTKVLEIKQEFGLYYAHFDGSHESIGLGEDKPSLAAGDRVKITFEKVTDAKPL